MGKIYTFIFLLFISTFITAQSTYQGNAMSGFGSVIGSSSLEVTDNGTTITFTLTRGGADWNDALVFYIDSKTGGFTTTSSMNDQADGLRMAISGASGGNTGLDPNNRSTVNFPAGFEADYAIALNPNTGTNFGGLWSLATGGDNSLQYVNTVNLTPNNSVNSTTYTWTVAKSDLGITGATTFKFVATYLNQSNSYRSNEGYGDGLPASNVGAGTGTAPTQANFTAFKTYTSSLPVTLVSFSGILNNGIIVVSWKTATESNLSHFDIEISDDANTWKKAATVAAKNVASGFSYSQTVTASAARKQFARLKVVEKDGRFTYSAIINFKAGNTPKFELLGNPVKSDIKVAINSDATAVAAELISLNGKTVLSQNYKHQGGSSTWQLQLNHVRAGIYILNLSSNGSKQSFKVMVQ